MNTQPPTSRPSLPQTPPDYHGALDYAELARWGYAPEDVIDFSVNSNPFGTHPAVREAIIHAPFDRYPDKECFALRERLATHHAIDANQIIVGNGTAEIIWQLAFAFLEAGDRVGVVTPTFGEYARNARLMGARVENLDAYPLPIARYPLFKMIFLCHPNNPTGALRDLEAVSAAADAAPETIFVIDEAYLNFVGAASSIGLFRPNIITLRSMTKDYALAGLRLGYAVAHSAVIDILKRVRVPWNVSEVAQVAGVAALAQHVDYTAQWASLNQNAQALKAALSALGFPPDPSPMHYFLLDVVGKAGCFATGAAFRETMLRHGLIVRNCESFGLPNKVRIATLTPRENARLLDAVRRVG
ncbi:MAG: pyridoxal phosphate-dependent aminotransferase [Candidatus Promineifilaceae bacterium]